MRAPEDRAPSQPGYRDEPLRVPNGTCPSLGPEPPSRAYVALRADATRLTCEVRGIGRVLLPQPLHPTPQEKSEAQLHGRRIAPRSHPAPQGPPSPARGQKPVISASRTCSKGLASLNFGQHKALAQNVGGGGWLCEDGNPALSNTTCLL